MNIQKWRNVWKVEQVTDDKAASYNIYHIKLKPTEYFRPLTNVGH